MRGRGGGGRGRELVMGGRGGGGRGRELAMGRGGGGRGRKSTLAHKYLVKLLIQQY